MHDDGNLLSGWLDKQVEPGPRADCAGNTFAALKERFLRDGHVTFKSCTIQNFVERMGHAARYQRIMQRTNAARDVPWVRPAVNDADTLELLQYIYGAVPLPFQSLSFTQGTERKTHSDVVHFDTLPQRGRMAASWLALEDVDRTAGPVHYYSGSHRRGLWDYVQLGLEDRWLNGSDFSRRDPNYAIDYSEYQDELQKSIDAQRLRRSYALLRRGETFLWAASLLHGGSPIEDHNRTRRSVATHYFFRPDPTELQKYWVPSISRLSAKTLSPKPVAHVYRNASAFQTDPNQLPPGFRVVDQTRIDCSLYYRWAVAGQPNRFLRMKPLFRRKCRLRSNESGELIHCPCLSPRCNVTKADNRSGEESVSATRLQSNQCVYRWGIWCEEEEDWARRPRPPPREQQPTRATWAKISF